MTPRRAVTLAVTCALVGASVPASAQPWPAPSAPLGRWASPLPPPPPPTRFSLPPPPPASPDELPPARRSRASSLGGDADRPRGTIDGGEAVTLYALGGVYGLTLGVWGAVGATENRGSSGAAAVLLPVAGVGVGLLGAALLDGRRDIRRGRVYAANAGFYLGLLAAAGVSRLPDGPARDLDAFGQATVFLGAATAGLGAGVGVAHVTDAQPGSASFVLSGGVWGGAIGGWLQAAFREARGAQGPGAGILAGEAVGAVAALLTAHLLQPTPAQTRWLDLGGLLGALGGALVFSQSADSQKAAFASAVGCAAGATLGFVLGAPSEGEREMQRRWSARAPSWSPTFTPAQGGGVLGIRL